MCKVLGFIMCVLWLPSPLWDLWGIQMAAQSEMPRLLFGESWLRAKGIGDAAGDKPQTAWLGRRPGGSCRRDAFRG